MSDDEREEHDGDVSYRIRTPAWRNPLLIPFLREFDRLGAIFKENDALCDRRGNPIHNRISGGASVVGRVVRGLPANAYDSRWKERLSEGELLWLAEGPDYDFRHDQRLSRYTTRPTV
jgi:hypothetical protein